MIRSRPGGVFAILPGGIFFQLGILFESGTLALVGIILGILGVIFGDKVYELLMLDANSPCALYAGNLALQYGFSPKAQNGKVWNPRNYKVSEVYNMYPDKRQKIPESGTCGFMFYTNEKGDFSRHMEFYDYSKGGDSFEVFKFLFHPWRDDGDRTNKESMKINRIPKNVRFVALEKL